MKVPFFDLTRQYESLRDEIDAAVADVLTTQRCIGGPHVQALEEALAARVGVAHGIGVSSGTDALLVSLMALGIGPGDEVITSPFTFVSPVEVIMRVGATPVFADIDETFCLDPAAVEAAVTPRTRAILPVHLFGQTCDMAALGRIADEAGLLIVEDLAQALGATFEGRQAGSFGDLGAVSFFPTKNLGAAGDGGMVFCDDDELAARVRCLCRHGAQPKYHHVALGGNFRLDALQAAILGAKLPHLDAWNARRRAHAAFYDQALAGVPDVTRPTVGPGRRSVYNQYVIRSERRDELQAHLAEAGIGTAVYYPEPLHTQPAFRHLGRPGQFPRAEAACRQVLALPIFPELTEGERTEVGGRMSEV